MQLRTGSTLRGSTLKCPKVFRIRWGKWGISRKKPFWKWAVSAAKTDTLTDHINPFFDLKLELGSEVSTVVSLICMYRVVQVYVQFKPPSFKLHRHCKTASKLWYSRINDFINEDVPVLNPTNIWNSNFESAHVHSWSEHL